MDETFGIIYCITCLVNGKRYNGKTTQAMIRRWQQHCNAVNSKQNYMFVNAMRKHGVENFIGEQIDIAKDQEELDRLEMFHIAMYQTFTDRSKGYNSTVGGEGIKLTQEIIEKRNASNKGKKRSEETKAKMRVSQAVSQSRPEYRKARSAGLKGHRVGEATRMALRKANFGKKQTPETVSKRIQAIMANPGKFDTAIKAMAEANRGKKRSPEIVKKVGDSRRGIKMSTEQRQASRDLAAKLNYADKMRVVGKANLGRKMTDEDKRILSEKIKLVWARKKADAILAAQGD